MEAACLRPDSLWGLGQPGTWPWAPHGLKAGVSLPGTSFKWQREGFASPAAEGHSCSALACQFPSKRCYLVLFSGSQQGWC